MAGKKAAKKKLKKEPPAKKPRQQRLPGTEDAKIKKLHDLAEDYMEARDARMAAGRKEKVVKDEVIAEMKRSGRENYNDGELQISLVHEKENLKVKRVGDDDDVEVTSSKGNGGEPAEG